MESMISLSTVETPPRTASPGPTWTTLGTLGDDADLSSYVTVTRAAGWCTDTDEPIPATPTATIDRPTRSRAVIRARQPSVRGLVAKRQPLVACASGATATSQAR